MKASTNPWEFISCNSCCSSMKNSLVCCNCKLFSLYSRISWLSWFALCLEWVLLLWTIKININGELVTMLAVFQILGTLCLEPPCSYKLMSLVWHFDLILPFWLLELESVLLFSFSKSILYFFVFPFSNYFLFHLFCYLLKRSLRILIHELMIVFLKWLLLFFFILKHFACLFLLLHFFSFPLVLSYACCWCSECKVYCPLYNVLSDFLGSFFWCFLATGMNFWINSVSEIVCWDEIIFFFLKKIFSHFFYYKKCIYMFKLQQKVWNLDVLLMLHQVSYKGSMHTNIIV